MLARSRRQKPWLPAAVADIFIAVALTIHLHGGSQLSAERISGGGYIAAPIGAKILGAGQASRQLTGHYVIIVTYLDGQRGLIAQDQIATIYDQNGQELEFGNSKYPGHRDYDPRNGDSRQEMAELVRRLQEKKFQKNSGRLVDFQQFDWPDIGDADEK